MEEAENHNDLSNHHDNGAKDELSSFLRHASKASIPSKKSKEDIWSRIEEVIDSEDATPKSIPIWRYISIAAAVALLATFSVIFLNAPEDVQVAALIGETKVEVLPDGSTVYLNASSSITYSEDWNREISLTGEAFFEVSEGYKFIVKTNLGDVQVLGTSFNVFVRDNDFEVACKTGKVKVSIPSKSFEENITPGQLISLKEDTVKRFDRLPELMGKWQAGEFYFNNQPIKEVIEELQRQFSIEIEFDGSREQIFSGYFTNTNLNTALDMVCLPLGLEYQKTGQNTFAISKSTQ